MLFNLIFSSFRPDSLEGIAKLVGVKEVGKKKNMLKPKFCLKFLHLRGLVSTKTIRGTDQVYPLPPPTPMYTVVWF